MNFERQCHILILVIVDFTAKGNAVFIDGCSSALVLLKVFVLLSLLKSGKFSCQTFVIVGTAYFFIHSFGVYFRNASCVAGWGRGAGQGRTPPHLPEQARGPSCSVLRRSRTCIEGVDLSIHFHGSHATCFKQMSVHRTWSAVPRKQNGDSW